MRREPEPLGEFEQMVLLAVLRGGAQAYGVTVYEELQPSERSCLPGRASRHDPVQALRDGYQPAIGVKA